MVAAAEVPMPLSHPGPVCHSISVCSQGLAQRAELMAGAVCLRVGWAVSASPGYGAPGFQTGPLCSAKSLFLLIPAVPWCPCGARELLVKVSLALEDAVRTAGSHWDDVKERLPGGCICFLLCEFN